MKISFKTSQQESTWDQILAVWQVADDIEVFHGGWLFDHFYPLFTEPSKPCMEAWSTAAALAAMTTRLRIGHMVTSNTYRHPAVVANTIATVDLISNGRLDFGFGAGWFEDEHEAYGIPLPPLGERFDRFDEALEVIHQLLTKDKATFEGEHYQIRNAFCEPKPKQRPHPPFVVGGKGEKRLLRSAARWADHYNYPGADLEDFRYRLDVLDRWCGELGRDRSEIETSLQIRVHDVGEAVAEAAAASEAGADHVIFFLPPPPTVKIIERLGEASVELVDA
ncbi:MAG: LLM class F420-dependent oxidoreductase [Acidimicrobiia bacterium]